MTKTACGTVVVIANWRRPADTIECIHSVLQSQGVDLTILVVDNGSDDDSVKLISEACPQVEILGLEKNLGFAGGYNAGIHWALEAGAKQVFLLNNDTIIHTQTIRLLLEAPWDVAIPKIFFYKEPGRIWAAGCRWRPFPPTVVMNGLRKMDGPRFDQPKELDYATGCAMMVKSPVLLALGGFDQTFENYLEDYDFSYRVNPPGSSMGYTPTSKVWHKVSSTLGLKSPKFWFYLGRNTVLFYLKDQRFPLRYLLTYLLWAFIRETIHGNLRFMSHFFTGIQVGFKFLRSTG